MLCALQHLHNPRTYLLTHDIHQTHKPPTPNRDRIPRRWFRSSQQIRYASSLLPFVTPAHVSQTGPDPLQVGEHVVTQKSLYTILFVVGIPLLWFASPLSTIFWIVGASALLILGHASLMEPGIESEYAQVSDSV